MSIGWASVGIIKLLIGKACHGTGLIEEVLTHGLEDDEDDEDDEDGPLAYYTHKKEGICARRHRSMAMVYKHCNEVKTRCNVPHNEVQAP